MAAHGGTGLDVLLSAHPRARGGMRGSRLPRHLSRSTATHIMVAAHGRAPHGGGVGPLVAWIDWLGRLLARAGTVVDRWSEVDIGQVVTSSVGLLGHRRLSAASRTEDTGARTVHLIVRLAVLRAGILRACRRRGVVVVAAGVASLTELPLDLLIGLRSPLTIGVHGADLSIAGWV